MGGFLIHLVTGKGGVGKSTYAAALALHLAQSGQNTLLVEFGNRSYQRHLFQTPVGQSPVSVQSHLQLAIWDGEYCLREYLLHLLKVDRLVSLFFDNKVMRSLVQAAPALRELALLGKLTSRERRVGPALNFETIVVDAYATGHFRALWRAARGMAEAIPFGPMGEQSRSMEKVLSDSSKVQFHIVATPEELPVTEGLELADDIAKELKQTAHFVLNRMLKVDITTEQLRLLKDNEFAKYVEILLERQQQAEQQVRTKALPISFLPWEFVESPTERIRQLAQKVVLT